MVTVSSMKNSKFFEMRSFVALVFTVLFSFGLVACTGGGGGEGGGEGAGHEGGGEGGMFVSDGESRGMLEFPLLEVDESFAGLLGGMEIAIYYDSPNEMFKGRLRNEAAVPVCDISVSISADGSPVGQPYLLDGLAGLSSGSGGGEGSEGGESGGGEGAGEHGGSGEGGSEGGGEGGGEGGSEFAQDRSGPFSISVPAGFSQWRVVVNSHGCSSAPGGSGGGEGSEGGESGGGEGAGHEGGGGEGGSEGGGEGGGGESGDESSPPTPKADRSMGMANGQDYDFSFNESRDVFEGTVTPTSAAVCGSKTEIHVCSDFDYMNMMCNGGVIELGPTIPQDLQPGDMINIVMYTDRTFDTYSLHPEAGTCP